MDKAILIADSIQEIQRINQLAAHRNLVLEIGVRINPYFSFFAESGSPSKFGIDEDQMFDFLDNNDCPNVKIIGIHVHVRSQESNADILANYYKNMFSLAEQFQEASKHSLEFVNMGSGMGIQYSSKHEALDTGRLGEMFNEQMTAFSVLHPKTKIIIEVGRYAVGKSGVYVTTVLDKKLSYGKTYLILKNTLNGFARPSLACLVTKYSSETDPAGSEPLFSSKNAFEFLTLKENNETDLEKVTLVGNLCTSTDVVMEDILLPRMECGDTIIITNAGSYGAVLSPLQFSSQEKPAELFLTKNGEILT